MFVKIISHCTSQIILRLFTNYIYTCLLKYALREKAGYVSHRRPQDFQLGGRGGYQPGFKASDDLGQMSNDNNEYLPLNAAKS